MKCRRAQQLLFDFIDGMSNESLRVELDRHLGECPECERFSSEMTRGLALLRHAPTENLDEGFNWRVRLAIHRERNAPRAAAQGHWVRAWNLRYATGAGVAFAIMLVAGVMLFRAGTVVSPLNGPVTIDRSVPVATPQGPVTMGDVARGNQPAARTRSTLPTGQLVSGGDARSSLIGEGPLGAIDDPERSEAFVDSVFERHLVSMTTEQRVRFIERHLQRIQRYRVQSQQALPERPQGGQ
jgi:hypothetical protein